MLYLCLFKEGRLQGDMIEENILRPYQALVPVQTSPNVSSHGVMLPPGLDSSERLKMF